MKPRPEDDGLGGPRVFALSPENQASICSLYLQHPQNVDIGSSITLSGTPLEWLGGTVSIQLLRPQILWDTRMQIPQALEGG